MDKRRALLSLPIRKKLTLLLVLIFIPALAIIIHSGLKQRTEEITRAQNSSLLAAQSLAAQQEQIATDTKTMLSILAQLREVQTLDIEACNKLFAEIHNRFPFYTVIMLTDPDGNGLAASMPFAPMNLRDRKHIRDVIATHDFSVGEYIVGRASKVVSLNYTYPVLNAKGSLIGIVIAGFNLGEYDRLLGKVDLPENSAVVLADWKGKRLFRSPENALAPIGQPLPDDLLQRIAGDHPQGVLEGTSPEGIARVSAFKQLRLRDGSAPYMYIVVQVPKVPILQKANQQMLGSLLIVLIAALATLLLVHFFGTFLLVSPINRLVKATQQVGRGDTQVRTGLPHATDELGRLAQSFDAMASLLEKRDIERKNAEAQLQHQALNDELTGLPNRRLLRDRLTQALAVAKRLGHSTALLYIDLDNFKLVNDSLGHSAGDILLGQVAARLRSRVRASDTLARLGGDEFTIILARVAEREEATRVAREILDALAKPFRCDDHNIRISASIGISMFPKDAEDAAVLFQQADSAMYEAKRSGRNAARHYSPEIGSLVRERMDLETELRGAIERGEISVQYQPEFEVKSQRVVRFEALARWTHPKLGEISPTKFIPIAEEGGMIVALGAYVLERACAEAVGWQSIASSGIQVAVNVSSVQFVRGTFVDEVIEVLNRTGLRRDLLQLELTESVMVHGVVPVAETMKRLRELGVSLAIDDFGMGYSCLSYLPSLPFDALKIDRSFVSELHRPAARAMINSLTSLASNLGMRVIIEGVENEEQLAFIRTVGADEVQGYLLGHPTADPASQLVSLLRQDRAALSRNDVNSNSLPLEGASSAPQGMIALPVSAQ